MSARLGHEDVVCIAGKRKSGKSYKAKLLAASELAAGASVSAFDLHDEYSRKGRKTKATNLGPLTQRCTVDELIDKRAAQLRVKPLSLAVVPRSENHQVLADDLKQFLRFVRAIGNMTIIVDEVGELEELAYGELSSAATQSRHWGDEGCPIVFVAQRLVQIPKSARDQASILVIGLQNDPDDLKQISKITGSPQFAEKVSRLPRPGTLTWRDNEGIPTT